MIEGTPLCFLLVGIVNFFFRLFLPVFRCFCDEKVFEKFSRFSFSVFMYNKHSRALVGTSSAISHFLPAWIFGGLFSEFSVSQVW
jgi:hypothetical protein